MAEEYQGAPYATVYQPSSNAINNFVSLEQKKKDDADAQKDFAYKQSNLEQRQKDAMAKYAGVMMGGKQYNVDPQNPYAPILSKRMADAKSDIFNAANTGGMNDAMLGTMVQQRLQPIVASMDKYNYIHNQNRISAEAMKGVLPNQYKELMAHADQKAFFDTDPKTGNPVLSEDKLDNLDPSHDYFHEALQNSLGDISPINSLKASLKSTNLGASDSQDPTSRDWSHNKYKAFVDPTFHQVSKGANGMPVVSIKGATPTLDADHQPMTHQEQVTNPDGTVTTVNRPTIQLDDDAYSDYARKFPALPFQMEQALAQQNKKLADAGQPQLTGDKADTYKKVMAYKAIEGVAPIPDIYNDKENLTLRQRMAEQKFAANRKVAAQNPIANNNWQEKADYNENIRITDSNIKDSNYQADNIISGKDKDLANMTPGQRSMAVESAKAFKGMTPMQQKEYIKANGGSLPSMQMQLESNGSPFETKADIVPTTPKPTILQRAKAALGIKPKKTKVNLGIGN